MVADRLRSVYYSKLIRRTETNCNGNGEKPSYGKK